MNADEARHRIKEIQNGGGLDREAFPEDMKGQVAKQLWYDSRFAFGMEYGYLLAMLDVVKAGKE